MTDKLAVLSAVERRLAAVQTVDEAKAIRDQAEAIRVYAKSARKGLAIQNLAAEIKILAEQRAGELLKGVKRSKGGGQRTGSKLVPVLKANEIAPSTAKRWQVMANVPEAEVRAAAALTTERGRELTSSQIWRRGQDLKNRRVKEERGAAASRDAESRAVALGDRFGPETRQAIAAAEARLGVAKRALEDTRKKAERVLRDTLAPFEQAVALARDELEATTLPLRVHETVSESSELCPPLTETEMGAAIHAVNGCVVYQWWRAAGHPDPGEFLSTAYRQWLRPGDNMVLFQSAWRLAVASPGKDYRRWVVSVSSPGQPRWARYFWFCGVGKPPAGRSGKDGAFA